MAASRGHAACEARQRPGKARSAAVAWTDLAPHELRAVNAQAIHLLLLAGSARSGALSLRLRDAAQRLAQDAGASTSTIDLRTLALPLYDADLEAAQGVPEGARRLREAIAAADAVLVVTPEYNGFPTPLLINAFDWMSRLQAAGDVPSGLATTAGKPVGLLSSSPGPGGGLRAMNFLRQYVQMAFAMLVVPQQFALGRAHEAFDDSGALKDPKAAQAVGGVLKALLRVAAALRAA
jgi:chromate reductase, NAD(P)H dehydrogenase (quinone)